MTTTPDLRDALIACLAERFNRLPGQCGGHADALINGPLAGLIAAAATADRDASDYADAMDARMADAVRINRLRIAFLVLAESGHGGGMAEVRRWFTAGADGPIPWPGGAMFAAWAAEHDIYDCNGTMGFRTRDRGRAA